MVFIRLIVLRLAVDILNNDSFVGIRDIINVMGSGENVTNGPSGCDPQSNDSSGPQELQRTEAWFLRIYT